MSVIYARRNTIIIHNSVEQWAEKDCACSTGIQILNPAGQTVETDCACAASPTVASASVNRSVLWRQTPFSYHAALPSRHELLLSPHSPVGPVVLNEPALRLLEAFTAPTTPAQASARLPDLPATEVTALARQLATLGLLVPQGQDRPALCPAPAHDTLTAWLHVTNACNLRCSYCYVHKDAAAMDEVTGRRALEMIFRTAAHHGFGAVKLKYAGGEPTLNFSLVRFLHHHATRLAERQGLELRETLISNGVALSDEILAFVAQAGLRLALSLDISRQAHDAHRTFPDGQGSFDRVHHNLERALDRGIQPYLSITLTGGPGEESADAVALALAHDLPFNLNFVRPADGIVPPEQIDALTHTVQAAFGLIEADLPSHSLLATLDRANFGAPHRHPCGAGRSYLVIDHHGRISPCQMEMARPAADLQGEDPLAALAAAFPNPAVEEREACAACPWRHWCAGGCPWLARRTADHVEAPSPYCAVYQALYPELLRLEGLRLLKYGDTG